MQDLITTTPEYWPINAKQIMDAKNIDTNELKQMFPEITFPWDDKYNTARVYFSLRIQQRPLFIIKPLTIKQIEASLNYVKLKDLTIRVMNGRHSSAQVSSEVLLDMSAFTDKELKDDVLIAGSGNTQGALNEFLFNQNSLEHYSHFGSFMHPRVVSDAFPGGSAASVGSAGIATSGGIGTLCRTYSLTIDSILSFKITLCPTKERDAITVIASREKNMDLFWALRGGVGSNFGVVSEISYKIIEVPEIIQYSIVWKWNEAAKILRKWEKNSASRPVQFNEDIVVYHNPVTGKQGIELSGYYVLTKGITEKDAVKAIHKQLDNLGGKLTINKKISYSDLYKKLVSDRQYYNFSIIQVLFGDVISSKEVVNLIDKAKRLNGPASVTFTLLGGKISKESNRDMAFWPREKKFFIDIASFWQGTEDSQAMDKWTSGTIKCLLDSDDDSYVYVGFPMTFTDIKCDGRTYFGKNYCKLREIKKRYDPEGILTSCGTIKK